MGTICIKCILFTIGPLLLGLLFGRLFFGANKQELLNLKESSQNDKSNLNKIVNDFNKYKAEASNKIEQRDKEIQTLKTANQNLSNNTKSGSNKKDVEKYKSLKKESENLTKELTALKIQLENRKAATPSLSDASNPKVIEELKLQLKNALTKIRHQDMLLLQAKQESFPTSNEKKYSLKSQVKKHKKKAKKYKKALQKIKSKNKK